MSKASIIFFFLVGHHKVCLENGKLKKELSFQAEFGGTI
jgi:hypothetical protein